MNNEKQKRNANNIEDDIVTKDGETECNDKGNGQENTTKYQQTTNRMMMTILMKVNK